MRIFLSSTTYDLADFRSLTVNVLEKRGHQVLFHENPTFPARVGLHSHDQCLEAVANSDLVICLIDKRYGGKYAGARSETIAAQKFSVHGDSKSGKKKSFDVVMHVSSLSITWIELITAHKKGIPVITFARQRTLDEKETRRRNQFLSSFKPAYAERNELFDLIDWVTKQKVNNWIASFHSMMDFDHKLNSWLDEIEHQRAVPKVGKVDSPEKAVICILVEGESDRLFISFILRKLNLSSQFVIIPTRGKYYLLNNFKVVVAQYSYAFRRVIVVLDSDAETEIELEQSKHRLQLLIDDSGARNVDFFFAHPVIEAWIAAGLDPAEGKHPHEVVTKQVFSRLFGDASINHVTELLAQHFSYNKAMASSSDFRKFVDHILSLKDR